MPEVYAELLTCVEKLERHFGDMQVRGLVCHVYIRLCIYFVLLLYISRSPLHSYWFLLHLERQMGNMQEYLVLPRREGTRASTWYQQLAFASLLDLF
jgi:hypothetical protein